MRGTLQHAPLSPADLRGRGISATVLERESDTQKEKRGAISILKEVSNLSWRIQWGFWEGIGSLERVRKLFRLLFKIRKAMARNLAKKRDKN